MSANLGLDGLAESRPSRPPARNRSHVAADPCVESGLHFAEMLGDTLESGDALVAMFALESLIVASVPLLLAPLGTLGTMLGVLGSFLGSPGTQNERIASTSEPAAIARALRAQPDGWRHSTVALET